MDPIIVFGLTASVIVAALVQALKLLGLPRNLWTVVQLLACIFVMAISVTVKLFPESIEFVQAIVAALLLFVGSSGAYHTSKNIYEAVVE